MKVVKILLPDIVKKQVDDSHYYWVNGEYYPGVTTILEEAAPVAYQLKQYYIKNSAEEIQRKSEQALATGSHVHDAIARLLQGEKVSLNEEFKNTREKKMVMSFHNWFHDVQPMDYVAEHAIASVSMKFAGTLDFGGWLNSEGVAKCLTDDRKFEFKKPHEFWIIDFKTSAGVYFNYKLQVMAYKKAYEEMYHQKVDHVGVLRVGTKNKEWFEFVEVKESEVNFEDFQKIYDLYLKMHGGKIPDPPKIDVFPDTLQIVDKTGGEK